jgi:hypothetical protein
MAGDMQASFDVDTSDPMALVAAFEKLEAGSDLTSDTSGDSERAAAEKAAADAAAAEKAAAEKAAADAAAADQDKSKQAAAAADANQNAAEQDAAGVATKDGKHVIPYSVLKSERDRAGRAEQLLRETQERNAALEAQLKSGNPGSKDGDNARTTQAQTEASVLSDEDLAALKEDFPSVHKAVMASLNAAKAMEAQLKPVQDSVREVEADRQRSMAEQVQDAIDSTPKLAHIKANDPAAFELAKQFDNTLKGQPAWKDKPMTERFAKVVALVEQANGEISIPGQTKTPPAPAKSAEQLKQEAKAAAEAAAKAGKTHVPTSLSDFPAGEPAAKDEREAVENMNNLQLAEKFAGMSPEQMDAYLSNL